MKALIISILIFLTVNLPGGKAFAQNIWYVDKNATGVTDGRSWGTAWRSLDSVWMSGIGANWYIVQGGDSIYISGGTDSTLYTPIGSTVQTLRGDDGNPITFSPQVVIAPANVSGRTTGEWANHIGDVYFYNNDTTISFNFAHGNIGGLKLVNLHFWTNTTILYTPGPGGLGAIIQNADNVTYDNCHFFNARSGAAFGWLGCSYVTVSNSLIENETNAETRSQDILTFGSGGKGGHRFINNTIINRNIVDISDSHADFIQVSGGIGDDDYLETVFINNFMWQITPLNNIDYNAGFYSSSGLNVEKQRYTFINNIMILDLPDTNYLGIPNTPVAIWLRGEDGGGTEARYSLRMFNNTIIYPSNSLLFSRGDTLIARNNFFIKTNHIIDGSGRSWIFTSWGGINYVNSDYNHWYVPQWDNLSRFWVGGANYYTFSAWQALEGTGVFAVTDNNSDSGYVSLVDVADSVISAYMTPVAQRGAGENLSYLASTYPEIMYDIEGNPRPLTGPWDIGALQFQGGPQNGINVKGKVFLQGPFSSNVMSTSLNQGGYLPDSQPYNSPPWNYNGSESFPSGPNSTMVDWVLVELRSASNPAQLVARRAAVLKNNGLLLEPNGMEGVFFNNVDPGSYHIAIYHRNHLAIMSSTPVQLSSNSQVYDFTNAMNKAYGQEPMVGLGTGLYGMYAADGDGYGDINSSDYNLYLSERGTMGYKGGDFNMDSGVSVYDVNQFYNINEGKESQVP